MLRIFSFLIFLLIFSCVVSASNDDVFNVDLFCGWGSYYRPMEWTPMEISVSSTLEKPFDGTLTLAARQDGLNTLNVIHDFVLTPDVPEHMPLVTKLAITAQTCTLKINKKEGKAQWSNEYELWSSPTMGGQMLKTANEQDMLIGIVGMGKFGLLRLDRQSISQFQGNRGSVYIGTKQPMMVPWDWTGFVSLDLLILYDPDWNDFNTHQLKAIAQWISNGGRLFLVLGSNPPHGENPLLDMIPFEFMEAKQITIAPWQLARLGLSNDNTEDITSRLIVPKPDARFYEGEIYEYNQHVFATGYAGYGRIGVLAFDPSQMSQVQIINSSDFWVRLIKNVIEKKESGNNPLTAQRTIEYVEDINKIQNRSGNSYRYDIGMAYALNNQVMVFLYQEIKPLSVWFVILLLGTLAVLLGPVDYKFLKRIDRLPLTWLTCSFWIILFTVGAYYGVQALRGGRMQLRAVSVLDGIKDSEIAWSTNYSGLFASRSDSYQLEGLKADQWWSGIAPSEYTVSSYDMGLGSRRIYCVQQDGGNLPDSLPVNIWDIQCMLTEAPLEEMPFDAEVERNSNNITVTIINQSDTEIVNGYVLFNNNEGIELGGIPPNAEKQFQKQKHGLRYWQDVEREYYDLARYRNSYNNNFKNAQAFFAQGCLQRTQAIYDYLSKGAVVVCVQYKQAPIMFGVKDRSFDSQHIQLARLVVFPK